LTISLELYNTTGLLKLPVKIPLTNKNGIKLIRYVLIKLLINVFFLKEITNIKQDVINETQQVYNLSKKRNDVKNKIKAKNRVSLELKHNLLIGK
tara:strand:- start:92 stop:376 length:285 start_codon:yes stop_codon:yes gene_type:complete